MSLPPAGTIPDERYRQILTGAADAMVIVDDAMTVAAFNRGSERIFGYAPGQVVGRSLDLLWPPRLVESNRARIVASDNNGTVAELTALRANGEEFPIEVSISKIAGGQAGLVLLVARDIGERKRGEQRLKQLARALEQSANLVIVCNADGTVDYVNPRFLSTTGYDRNELIGRLPFFWQDRAKSGGVNE